MTRHTIRLDKPAPLEEDAPMRRYVFPITGTKRSGGGEPACSAAAMTQLLEQISTQNQLLVDLLAAVNGLTSAILCQEK